MKIDCIIPLYNKKNFIINSVNSALKQKYKKFNKIIIINDGSTDGGDIVLNKNFKNNNLIEIHHQKNSGSSEARNLGIKLSSADFIVFLDADDQLHNKYLACLYLMLKKHPNSKVFSTKHHNIYENTELISNSENTKLYNKNIVKLSNPILNYSINQRIFCSSGICIQKELIEKHFFPKNVNVGEDIYTWLKIFIYNHLIYYDSELIFIFKISENRSIELYKEIPYYLRKINEFRPIKKISYKIYFLISSLIFLYQVKNESKFYQEFLISIRSQSLNFYLCLKFFDNKLFLNLYKIFKNRKDNLAMSKVNISTENFLLLTLNYFLILPSIPMIILSLYLTKQYELISEILVISSLSIMFSSSLTYYARPFALIKNKIKLSLIFLKLKKILFLPLMIILSSLVYLFDLTNFYTLIIGVYFVLYIWKIEANIAIYELINSKKLLIKNFLELLSVTMILLLSVLHDSLFLKLISCIYLLVLNFSNIFIKLNFNQLKKVLFVSKRILDKNFLMISLNSLTLNFTNFIHRYLIIFYVEKTFAGILFFIYSMGSFPSNLFNYVFISTIIRNRFGLTLPVLLFLLPYMAIFLYFSYIYFFKVDNFFILNFFDAEHILYVLFSMIGGLIMSYAMYNKNKIFVKENSLQKILSAEVIYSMCVIFLIPIIFNYFTKNEFGYIFFINSIFAFFIFTGISKMKDNE